MTLGKYYLNTKTQIRPPRAASFALRCGSCFMLHDKTLSHTGTDKNVKYSRKAGPNDLLYPYNYSYLNATNYYRLCWLFFFGQSCRLQFGRKNFACQMVWVQINVTFSFKGGDDAILQDKEIKFVTKYVKKIYI